ncbi:MAG: hypothetical protein GX267_15815 [Fibrobacter sp.]|jgi:hypothetical protein|nr:hypothetical protein [Fibrobacter sp.]
MTDTPVRPIKVTPEQKKHYEMLLPEISALPEYTTTSMPLDEAVGEANRVIALIKEDRAKLERSGIELHYLDSFEARAGAMIWSAAELVTYINMESTAKKEWDRLQPEAKELRRDFLKVLKRAFRKDKELTDAVKRIRGGRGYLDRVLDFLSMSKLAQENKELLEKVYADLSLIDRSSKLYARLTDILSRMVIDPKKMNKAKTTFFKAWTYLNEARKEIFEAGQYVFKENDPRHKLYYSKYHVKLGKKAAAKAKQKKNSAKEAKEKSKKDKEMAGA